MNLERPAQDAALESKLRSHPGVSDAALLSWKRSNQDPQLIAFVVPRKEYLKASLAAPDDEAKRVQKWRKTYDLTYSSKEPAAEPDFNIRGWRSSYTRLPVPDEQMREWVVQTVDEISRLTPSHVLEIGCGSGLLLLRLAPNCQRYVGIDNSSAAIGAIDQQMKQLGGKWSRHVQLLERSADRFDGLPADSFDTVILNSVAQYFPSLEYFLAVLEKALDVVKPGGRIFLGDLRSLPLQPLFATSVELFRAPPESLLSDLRERIARRLRLDEELIYSPALFVALRRRWPKISRVTVQPRRGRCDNEMNRYRYSAVLHVGSASSATMSPEWASWPEGSFTWETLAHTFEKPAPNLLAFTHVPNARISGDMRALSALISQSPSASVGSLQAEIATQKIVGIHPEDLAALGQKFGYDVQISWAAARADGSFDVVFSRNNPGKSPEPALVAWPDPATSLEDLDALTNAPSLAIPREKLLQQLREFGAQNLPARMGLIPYILVSRIPKSLNGDLDSAALPAPGDPFLAP